MDRVWWETYVHKVKASPFNGKFYTCSNTPTITKIVATGIRNSGSGAIMLCKWLGSRRIILLGYDATKQNGVAHWHEDHPKGLGNAGSCDKWPVQFSQMAQHLKGVTVTNASRSTAIECWPKRSLEDCLQ